MWICCFLVLNIPACIQEASSVLLTGGESPSVETSLVGWHWCYKSSQKLSKSNGHHMVLSLAAGKQCCSPPPVLKNGCSSYMYTASFQTICPHTVWRTEVDRQNTSCFKALSLPVCHKCLDWSVMTSCRRRVSFFQLVKSSSKVEVRLFGRWHENELKWSAWLSVWLSLVNAFL